MQETNQSLFISSNCKSNRSNHQLSSRGRPRQGQPGAQVPHACGIGSLASAPGGDGLATWTRFTTAATSRRGPHSPSGLPRGVHPTEGQLLDAGVGGRRTAVASSTPPPAGAASGLASQRIQAPAARNPRDSRTEEGEPGRAATTRRQHGRSRPTTVIRLLRLRTSGTATSSTVLRPDTAQARCASFHLGAAGCGAPLPHLDATLQLQQHGARLAARGCAPLPLRPVRRIHAATRDPPRPVTRDPCPP